MSNAVVAKSEMDWSAGARDVRSLLQQEGITPEAIRATQQRIEADNVQKRRVLQDTVQTVVSGLRDLAKAGHKVDFDPTIDQIDEIIESIEQETRETSHMMTAVQKRARRHHVGVATALGHLQQSFLEHQRYGIQTFSAGRWELMVARAEHLPPPSSGKMRGEHTDLDEYLASRD